MCILIYNWTTDQSNQSWAALSLCNCCNITNKKKPKKEKKKEKKKAEAQLLLEVETFPGTSSGWEGGRAAMSMNMQWGLISGLVLPWRMALSPAWCCLNMNFIRTHLSWLVMGFCTVLSPAHTPFPIMALEIFPYYYSFLLYWFPVLWSKCSNIVTY